MARDIDPPDLLDRPTLRSWLAERRVAGVVAPAGYGKTTLVTSFVRDVGDPAVVAGLPAHGGAIDSVAGALRRGLLRAGLLDAAAALAHPTAAWADPAGFARAVIELVRDREEPVVLVMDDVHGAAGPAWDAIEVLAGSLPAPHRLVLVGRRVPGNRPPNVPLLGAEDLAFRPDEIVRLARTFGHSLDEAAALAIVDATGGWPAAAALAARHGLGVGASGRLELAEVVETVLSRTGASTRRAARLLAHLPLLHPALADVVAGRGALDRVVAAGIPVRRRLDGWFAIPEAVREVLGRQGDPSPAEATTAAGWYLDAGEPAEAIDLLVGAGREQALVALLAARPWHELAELGTAELRSVIALLPDDAIAAGPRLLVSAARVAEGAVELGWRAALLERAEAAASGAGDRALEREIRAERAFDAVLAGDADAAIRLADLALDGAAAAEQLTRGRALWAKGRALAFERSPSGMLAAIDLLTEAALVLRAAGEHRLRSAVLVALGFGIHFAQGELDAAVVRLREAAAAAPQRTRHRAAALHFLADALCYLGALDEGRAALREAAEISRRLRDQRLLGYHAWLEATVASRAGDTDAVRGWLEEAERHPGDWFVHPTGIEFLGEAVEALGRVGDEEGAARYLARVEARCAADGRADVAEIGLVARAVHGARFGDPATAERDLVRVLGSPQLPAREAWRMVLLRALAAARRGALDDAARLAGEARRRAGALGHPRLPELHEAEVVARLERLVPPGTRPPGAPATDPGEPGLVVRILGTFAVERLGRAADPPPGRPALLVKLLAVRGSPVAVEEIVEILWPETDEPTGRARLRNVLARVRAACGALVERDGETLRLAPSTVVDAAAFERDARAGLAIGGDPAEARLRTAAARYAGELLPADRYEDAFAGPRERLAQLHLAVVDRLATSAEDRGDVEEVLRLAEEVLAVAPLEEAWYARAARIALAHGRRRRAASFLRRARAMLDDLGVPPSEELMTLEGVAGAVAGAESGGGAGADSGEGAVKR